MNNGGTLQSFIAEISKAVETFAEPGSTAKQVLNDLASSDQALFFPAAICAVAASKPSEGSRYLILILAKDKRLSNWLLDPKMCTLPDAVAAARAAAQAGAQLQTNFEMALNQALRRQANPQNTDRILRALDVLAVTCDQNGWDSFQMELMAYPDKAVRSKAALLIGRSTHNAQWIGRRLLDRDPRVQASAVEALWGLDGAESRPHLLAALKSKHNRVAANAALGLYRIGDVTAMRVLLDMLRHPDSPFRLSALWAIGETQDERFLPVLAEHYKSAEGKLRLATIAAMSRIRRREKAGPLQIHVSQAMANPDGRRRLSFGLSCHPARDLSAIKPMEFAVWENGTPIEDYDVRLVSPPGGVLAGFVAPWFESDAEAYEKCVREALKQCLSMKRRDDLWRIDRYSIEVNPGTDEKSAQESMLPYDDALITPEVKASHSCIAEPHLLEKALALAGPRDHCSADPLAAIQRQCDAFAQHAGKRHIFLFLHDMSGSHLKQEAAIARLGTMARDSNVVLHGICPDVAGQWDLLRELCLSNPEGSYTEAKLEGMVDGLVDAYTNLSNRFEIGYSFPATAEPGIVRLKISSERGCGEAEVTLVLPSAAAPPEREEPVQLASRSRRFSSCTSQLY